MIGIISDVHANLPALEAVLDDMPDVDALVHAGDAVGYNPYPSACVELLRDNDAVCVQGNHDRAVAGDTSFGFHSDAGRAVEWTQRHVGDETVEWLDSLPQERETVLGERRIKMVHGAPGAPDRYTFPHDFSPSLLNSEDVLVLGHTHVQAKREYDEGTVVNPGSVGQPRDEDPRAGYALLDEETCEVELRRVEYPVSHVQDKIRRAGLPESLAERLEEGR
ncbi:MAG: YfcE family phosphodiesterase [Halobacteriales archaeon]|nr:YfcE family phosphodiesterase [Halobacteriales archaeon]